MMRIGCSVVVAIAFLLSFMASGSMFGAESVEALSADMITPKTKQAIDRGLEFLASRQQEEGSFGTANYGRNVAICALAGLAMMSGGSTPGRGPYGEQLDRCVDYLLSNTQKSGFIESAGSASHGPMYGHGFATMFLAECYGMSNRPDMREKLKAAVELIVNTQNNEGGWRYQPRRADADLSVTVCEIMALRAARNAGLFVPKKTIDKCIDYVKKSQNSDGGFRYMLQAGPSRFPRSAGGVVALHSAGIYEGGEIKNGLAYLNRAFPKKGEKSNEAYFYYGRYYVVLAAWHTGGDMWKRWYPAVREEMIQRQRKDGSWMSPISVEYATSMACIVLQVPNNCLPIFQR